MRSSIEETKPASFNGLLLLLALSLVICVAEPAFAESSPEDVIYKPIGAALAVGLSGIGAGLAIAVAGASGLSALAERPEMFSSVLLVVALGEGIAIYGLIVAL
ncbi:MAG: hypothetical protein QXU52_04750, partial [Fervidicoccaceae archaeon]